MSRKTNLEKHAEHMKAFAEANGRIWEPNLSFTDARLCVEINQQQDEQLKALFNYVSWTEDNGVWMHWPSIRGWRPDGNKVRCNVCGAVLDPKNWF